VERGLSLGRISSRSVNRHAIPSSQDTGKSKWINRSERVFEVIFGEYFAMGHGAKGEIADCEF
jgi:hypothetical protein